MIRIFRHVRFFVLAILCPQYGIMWRQMLTWWIKRDEDIYGSRR